MDYMMIKHSHMAIAVLSILLFYVRACSRLGSGKIAAHKGVFVGSHIVDTLLLVSAVALMFMASWNPLTNPWLWQKILLVIAFIVIGVKAAKATKKSTAGGLIALNTLVILAIGYLASTKQGFFG